MKYMILSLISSVALLLVLVGTIWYESLNVFSVAGDWHYESQGQSFKMSIEEGEQHVAINNQVFGCTVFKEGTLLVLVTDSSQSGQTPSLSLTFVFEVEGKNELELLSAGYKAEEKMVLIRK